MSGDSQAVEFSLTADDYAAFNEFFFRRNWRRWRFPLLRKIFLGFFAFYIALTLFTRWEMRDTLAGWGDYPLIIVILFLLLIPYWPRFAGRRQFRRANAINPKLGAMVRMEISPAGLSTTGGLADTRTPWSSIIEIAVGPAGAYLFILKNSAHVLPRRAFADGAGFDAFVAAARGWWRPGEAAKGA